MYLSLSDISPEEGSNNVAQDASISFSVESSEDDMDSTTLDVRVNGNPAITNGVFQTGYSGSISTPVSGELIVVISTHPDFPVRENSVSIYAEDDLGNSGWLSMTFNCDLADVIGFQARTWCTGKRINLSFTIPDGVEQISLKRSKYAFSTFYEDPAKTLYEGVPENLDASPIAGYMDGEITDSVLRSSGEALEEGVFYYYTLFVSYGDVNGDTAWISSENAQVEGLSIKQYPSDWFYGFLPEHYRKKDADPKRGTNRHKLRDYCRVLQCGLNLQRGWLEALLKLRDPDSMPAGRLDEASNQKCILSAQSSSLGMPPERSFDTGVLRSIVSNITSVYKKKGTCPGLIAFIKTFTKWDSRCDEAIEPLCGVNRLFSIWDASSYIRHAICTVPAQVDITVDGQIALNPLQFTYANGDALPSPPVNDEAFNFIIDALGTFYCVDSVGGDDPLIFYFANPGATVRAEIGASGVLSGPGQFQIDATYATTLFGGWPWQFPDTAPVFAANALKGLKLLDADNVLHEISGSEATTSITNLFIKPGTGDPVDGDVFIAYDYTLGATQADRLPTWKGRFFAGEFSLTYDPAWDTRHLIDESEPGPFSVLLGFGGPGALGSSATPSDITMWIANQHEHLSRVTGLTANTLTDSTASWTTNQWYGYYLLPSWEQTQIFPIVRNTGDTLVCLINGSLSLLTSSAVKQEYVILSKQNAYKYVQLVKALPSFVPYGTRVLVKFEEVV